MKRTGHDPLSLTELVEQLLIVYADRGMRNAATSGLDGHSRGAVLIGLRSSATERAGNRALNLA